MKEDKKEIILDTAERLFSEQGFDGTSTRAIAHEAGVNMAMLNYYFGSKEGLYKAVFERKLSDFHQTLTNLNEQNISPWEKLHQYIDVYVDRIARQSCFQRLIQQEISMQQQRSGVRDYIADTLVRNVDELKKILREGIENGSFRKIDIDMTVATIFGTKYYVTHLSALAARVLQTDLDNETTLQQEIKPRIKKHLTDLLDAHLRA